MRFPSKVTRYNDSVISYFPFVLKQLEKSNLSPLKLYRIASRKVKNVGEFIDVLDCLYALGAIDMTEFGDLHYVG